MSNIEQYFRKLQKELDEMSDEELEIRLREAGFFDEPTEEEIKAHEWRKQHYVHCPECESFVVYLEREEQKEGCLIAYFSCVQNHKFEVVYK